MDTRNTKRSKTKPQPIYSGNRVTYLLETHETSSSIDRDEAMRQRGKRQGETLYRSLRDEYGRGIHSSLIYPIDESSDDEEMAEMAQISVINEKYIRVKSEEVKKYDEFEKGLLSEGKRLARNVTLSSTGKCIRRIYDLDEASSDEEQPIVEKTHSKKQKKTSKCLSDLYDVPWQGYAPTETPPPVKIKHDYPYGTTRSGSNPEMKMTSKGAFYQRINKFFKPASLRQEESHLKNENPQVNGEFQWERGQKTSEDIVEQVTNIKSIQNKRFLRCS